MDQMPIKVNPLFVSLDAWNKCQQFLADAKAAVREEDRRTLCWIAAMWRAKHEMWQALYWQGVQP